MTREKLYWNRLASRYDRSMMILGGPMPRAAELAAAGVAGSQSVLEVAAGTGLITLAVAPKVERMIATDYAEAMVDVLRARVKAGGATNVACEQADLYGLAFAPGTFDAVIAANVLHLVPDLPRAVASLRRVLRAGGKLIVPTFCHDETTRSWLVSRVIAVSGFPGHRRFTTQSLVEALEGLGLTVLTRETIPGWIPIGFVAGTFVS